MTNPSYTVEKEEDDDFYAIRNAAGDDVATCSSMDSDFAKWLATGPVTKPLTLDDVQHILCREMDWEYEDVAGFFDAAKRLGLIKE